jgi:WD40 repeat protein
VALPNANTNSNAGQGQLVAASGDPGAGAPQSNGFYFPQTILYRSGNSVLAVSSAGGGGLVIGSGNAVRSLNGLFVATAGNGVAVVRPDGASVASGSGQSTLPSWSRDGSSAYWGSGAQLIRFQGGNTTVISTLNGNLTKVEVAPDGSTVLFANSTQVKLIMGDGTPYELWVSDGSSIIEGPFWANRNGQLGIYARLSDGRRVFMGGGFSTIDDPFEQLQQVSPINEGARVYIRQENAGNGYLLVAVWPGLPDREFVAKTLFDLSWSPDGAQLVYATPDGQLILLDLASGNGSVLASGGASAPIWSPARYIVKI